MFSASMQFGRVKSLVVHNNSQYLSLGSQPSLTQSNSRKIGKLNKSQKYHQ